MTMTNSVRNLYFCGKHLALWEIAVRPRHINTPYPGDADVDNVDDDVDDHHHHKYHHNDNQYHHDNYKNHDHYHHGHPVNLLMERRTKQRQQFRERKLRMIHFLEKIRTK